MQYWFDGPESSSLASNQTPNQMFELACSDATTGCASLNATFSAGLPGVRGARYVLTLGFAATAGSLLPETIPSEGASRPRSDARFPQEPVQRSTPRAHRASSPIDMHTACNAR